MSRAYFFWIDGQITQVLAGGVAGRMQHAADAFAVVGVAVVEVAGEGTHFHRAKQDFMSLFLQQNIARATHLAAFPFCNWTTVATSPKA